MGIIELENEVARLKFKLHMAKHVISSIDELLIYEDKDKAREVILDYLTGEDS